ncbi:MAG TPA: SDR family NAD(P)-dependent oxidoreductase [Dehalococcoidia bacterium]|nr:SDR family NAD(P)-dependent oxidoreductase [Dehalococcoidia bacterium]
MKDFAGKVAVVTGAASGMGRAFAERFAAEGMKVVLSDIEATALDAAVAEMRAAGHDITGAVTDVSKLESVQALAQSALAAYGKVHVVCNNAGVDGYLGTIWEATPRDWQWTFGVNFWGVVNGVSTFLPILLAQDEEAYVVNTSSATAIVPGSNIYGVTKHAVLAYSEAIHGQLKQHGAKVGISCLCPGTVNTKLFYGGRNRPAELRNVGETEATEPGAQARVMLRQVLAQSIPPSEVAGILLDAVRNERFYVLTDHDWDERARLRAEAILARGNPPLQPPRR